MDEEIQTEEINGDADEPVTKGEFNSTMTSVQKTLNQITKQMTKDRKELLQQMATDKKDIMEHIDVAMENRQVDLGAAKNERVDAISEKQARDDQRITVIEKHIGIAS